MKRTSNRRVLFFWNAWAPVHYRRLAVVRKHLGSQMNVGGLEAFNKSGNYWWPPFDPSLDSAVQHLQLKREPPQNIDVKEGLQLAKAVWHQHPTHVFIPAYHWISLVVLGAAKARRAKAFMMNDTFEGTARPGRLRELFRRTVLRIYDGALVAGTPQTAYFAKLGMKANRIMPGYGVVDEELLGGYAEQARSNPSARSELGLPGEYLLSLGRFIPVKRLDLLIEAYQRCLSTRPDLALVLAGYGPLESELEEQCANLGLTTVVRSAETVRERGRVVFYGPVDEAQSAALYALARATLLCSDGDTWGLVINESLACGTPVVCSDRAGCADDLVRGYEDSRVFEGGSVDDLTRAINETLDAADRGIPVQDRPLNRLDLFAESVNNLIEMFP